MRVIFLLNFAHSIPHFCLSAVSCRLLLDSTSHVHVFIDETDLLVEGFLGTYTKEVCLRYVLGGSQLFDINPAGASDKIVKMPRILSLAP